MVADVLPPIHDFAAKLVSDQVRKPATMVPATVAATVEPVRRPRAGTLCESSITLTYPPVRNANAAARKIATAKK